MAMLLPILSTAQSPPIKPLTIGDTVPDIVFNNVINYSKTSARLKDYKTPVILDFFATHCGGCIAALPHLAMINKGREDSLQVIVISSESKEKVQNFLHKNPYVKNNRLPFVTSDTILRQLFPHNSIPHEVWINANGIVEAITIAEYVTEENIQKWLAGNLPDLPGKDDTHQYNPEETLLGNTAAIKSTSLKWQSTLTGYLNNSRHYTSGDVVTGGIKRSYYINMSVLPFLQKVLNYKFLANRFILDIDDSSKLVNKHNSNDWFIKNAICYELMVPEDTPYLQRVAYIFKDIEQFLNMEIKLEKRTVPCFIMISDTGSRTIDPLAKSGSSYSNLFSEKNTPKLLQNVPISQLVNAMNSGYFGKVNPIVIDETGYSQNVDIKLGAVDIKDMQAMQEALKPYGFKIIKGSKLLEMVVLKSNKQ